MALQKNPNLDSVTTINDDGSHHKLHPANVSGKFTLARRIVGFIIILIYAALPWIPINGNPNLRRIYAVCKLTPDVQHWMPTREAWTKDYIVEASTI